MERLANVSLFVRTLLTFGMVLIVTMALGAFARSPHWGELRELDLGGDTVPGPHALGALLDAPNLATLRVLSLDPVFWGPEDEPCPDEAAALLARCRHLDDRLELRMSEGDLSPRGKRLLQDRFGDGLTLRPK